MSRGLELLREALAREGGTVATLLDAAPGRLAVGEGDPAELAARGPRAAGCEDDVRLLVDAIREGSLLHYGAGRLVQTDDPDLALLVGDRLYALGLQRLAALGDLEAVQALAETIAALAAAHAAGEEQAVAGIWSRGARRVGWGSAGDPDRLAGERDSLD